MTNLQLEKIGYCLHRNIKDSMKVKHKFCVSPANGTTGGPINYFKNMKDVDIWYNQVLEIRAIQQSIY